MENLTIIRKESHATQQEVADYLGISRQAYGNYESGKREPDYETLLKLGEYFNCSIDILVRKIFHLCRKRERLGKIGT